MSSATTCVIDSSSLGATLALGERLGRRFSGGEVIELISDVGGGKTALVRGLAQGIGSSDQVMSPTFTLSRIYKGQNLTLHHFDFYRLSDPGIMMNELAESLAMAAVAVAIEWSEVVAAVLPKERLQIRIVPTGETTRRFEFRASGSKHQQLLAAVQ